jgi:hypothetical protein
MAAEHWASAADHGNASGANHYGLCFEFGQGVDIDIDRAAQYYLKAANSDHAEAEYHFGFCLEHEHGLGIEMNLIEAAKYYRLSADEGHAGGLRSYARFLHYGLCGKEDLEGAAHYCELAAKHSPHVFEDHQFRCLRSLNRAPFTTLQFSDLSTVRLRVFREYQTSRPIRSGLVCCPISSRLDHHQFIEQLLVMVDHRLSFWLGIRMILEHLQSNTFMLRSLSQNSFEKSRSWSN